MCVRICLRCVVRDLLTSVVVTVRALGSVFVFVLAFASVRRVCVFVIVFECAFD